MLTRSYLLISMLAAVPFALAFAPPQSMSSSRRATALGASSMLESITQEDGSFLMDRAWECAADDECSVDDAKLLLKQVIRLQSGCAADGLVLAGSTDDVCSDVTRTADIVAKLRQKISSQSSNFFASFWSDRQDELENLVVSSLSTSSSSVLSSREALIRPPLQAAHMSIAALYTVVLLNYFTPSDTETLPVTFQEWSWSIRDGYFMDMFHHVLKNGGL